MRRGGGLTRHSSEHEAGRGGRTDQAQQCEFCGYTCRQKVSLNWHMKKNDVELSYSFCCELCGKWFKSKLNLHFHKGKSHPRLKSHRQKDRQKQEPL
ncbi:E3 ubiquitin-protein ligase ZFP91 [Acipenser ruthenus]|uniref:E3 ubiquitin-protein ligase ZFP91 n=1 Tax=Acipenser ruthenus TaxID=7906 RepID=A0A444TYT2_ACIRT|nr:E3 ubiquitin-protein ligase ZFP91 [Acipenser ruthenus]